MALVLPPGVCNLQFFLGIPWCIVYDLCFGNSVEGLIDNHEAAYSCSGVVDLYMYVTEEVVSEPYQNEHYCLWVYPG